MVNPRSRRSRRMNLDDLGLPAESDAREFARAFSAVARHYDVPLVAGGYAPATADTDDLGLPAESDPADFAIAFACVHQRFALAHHRRE